MVVQDPEWLRYRTARAHTVAICVSTALVLCFTAVLADGRSLVTLKTEDLPVITNHPYVTAADAGVLLGRSYGIGLHHDQAGRSWSHVDENVGILEDILAKHGRVATLAALTSYNNTFDPSTGLIGLNALKHPVTFFGCSGLRGAGLSAMALGCIADAIAGATVIFHTAALTGLMPNEKGKTMALLMWTLLSIIFTIIVMLEGSIYTTTWDCEQPIVPTLRLADSFDLTYGLPFAIVGAGASIYTLVVVGTGAGLADLQAVTRGTARALLLATTLAVVLLAASTALLADGRSLVTLKTEDLPIITNPGDVLADSGFLFRRSYGIGLRHDQTGRSWSEVDENVGTLTDMLATHGRAGSVAALTSYNNTFDPSTGLIGLNALKHPATFFACYGLRDAGLSAMALGLFAAAAASVLIIFHAWLLADFMSIEVGKTLSLLVSTLLSIVFSVIVVLGVIIYTTTWDCDQPVMPTLRLADSFDLAYGLPIAVVSAAASIVALIAVGAFVTPERKPLPRLSTDAGDKLSV